jgi:hypothetical protein
MTMTADAKQALKDTVQSLRGRLLADLHDATESAWQMGVRVQNAALDEGTRATRATFESWVAEQVRTQAAPATPARAKRARGRRRAAAEEADAPLAEDVTATATLAPARSRRAVAGSERTADDFRREAEKLAAATLLNRLVMLRLLEAPGPDGTPPMRVPAVVTGGWESRGYRDFRELTPTLVRGDATEGFLFLLKLVYADLAMELPGLYGDAGVADLVPIPPATLRHVIEALDDAQLASCWTDDMTLGWVYQYWNDPDRKAIDDKINAGGKIEPHEIASKTQLFTERYIVDWLLQNSLGPMWLAICKKHGWMPDVEADGTLANLETRRVEWRAKRDAGEVSPTDLMPQPLSDDAVAKAPESVRDLKIIDPAVGSGHFLVVTVGLLWALYREEARHRGLADHPEWSDKAIVERILEYNLHGIDLDPRAVQIAAAALWFAGRQISRDARPRRLNLVASNLRLASLPDNDPALVKLRAEVERDIGMPGDLVDSIIQSLRGADSLGSLLRIDRAVDEAIARHEKAVADRPAEVQRGLFGDEPQPARQPKFEFDATAIRRSLLDRLEAFLSRHTGSDDLGLRLAGQQLAAGVRFVRIVREGAYDLVVANPPYQDSPKLAETAYLGMAYRDGKRNLYAAFLLRGLEFARDHGRSAMLTIRDWMFLKQYSSLRETLLGQSRVLAIGDFERGAFETILDEVVTVAATVFLKAAPSGDGVALCPTPRDDRSRDNDRTARKRAATLCQCGLNTFAANALRAVPEWPLIYWWTPAFIQQYVATPKIGDISPVRATQGLYNNSRFIRMWHEVHLSDLCTSPRPNAPATWVPFINGADGAAWFEPLRLCVPWRFHGMQPKVLMSHVTGSEVYRYANEQHFFRPCGIAFSQIGNDFRARVARYAGTFGDKGRTLFARDPATTLCVMNSRLGRDTMGALATLTACLFLICLLRRLLWGP